NFAQDQGYDYELLVDDNMIANALVSGTTVKINSTANVPAIEANALAHHELGVHLVTTLNARAQPLKILSLGCPVNTMTQEGMAILSEYLAGHLSIKRLKMLALRVLAVESMIKEKSFRHTFMMLHEQYGVEKNTAFTITARVFRGGGFTKDYLYLKGFHQVLHAYEEEKDFLNLLCGKTALVHLPEISRLVDKGIFIPPLNITPSFKAPSDNDEIRKFITHAIK
uniref:tyrosine/phenylalanine carboxypeptidase domain-containing protein n=1 Tax=Thaumasiovibrio occultus TaxID=1891184 RepID=UPI00131C3020